MDNWYDLPMFTRVMFVIGFVVSILFVSFILGVILCAVESAFGHRGAKRKSVAAKPIDGTDYITYESTGSIKELGHELREITYRKKG